MYLHLGQSTIVHQRDIIGVFDMDTCTGARDTRDFLSGAQRSGEVVYVSEELPKSFVLCGGTGNARVYVSQLAPGTLLRRQIAAKRGTLF